MTHYYQGIADTYAGKICQLYTMHGIERARIEGRLNKFASIASLDSTISIQVNWPTVERKMQQDKLFYTC